jgi:hypothetical protein
VDVGPVGDGDGDQGGAVASEGAVEAEDDVLAVSY